MKVEHDHDRELNLILGFNVDQVLRIGVLGHFSQKLVIKISSFLHMVESYHLIIHGKSLNWGLKRIRFFGDYLRDKYIRRHKKASSEYHVIFMKILNPGIKGISSWKSKYLAIFLEIGLLQLLIFTSIYKDCQQILFVIKRYEEF